jgi:Tfp pilus assembly ATPase PilU
VGTGDHESAAVAAQRRGQSRDCEICLHAPKIEAVILKGNEQELTTYMLSGREAGMIDFQSALKAMQSVIDPQEFLLHAR